jgi:hypothetical protein
MKLFMFLAAYALELSVFFLLLCVFVIRFQEASN